MYILKQSKVYMFILTFTLSFVNHLYVLDKRRSNRPNPVWVDNVSPESSKINFTNFDICLVNKDNLKTRGAR